MTKICNSCKHQNSDAYHYCVKCGKPLETGLTFRPRNYVVISEDEYKGLKGKETTLANLQRSHRSLQNTYNNLRNNVNNTWWNRMKRKLSDFWEEYGIGFAWFFGFAVFAAIVIGIVYLWDSCSNSSDRYFIKIVQDENTSKYGLYNEQTKEQVLACDYDTIIHERADYYHFFYTRKAGLWGVTDSLGQVTIDCTLDSVRTSSQRNDCVLITYAGNKQGMMSNYGQVVLPCEFAHVLWISDMRKSSPSYLTPGNYVGNIIPVKRTANGQWELYNRNGELFTPTSYYSVEQTGHPDLVKVSKKNYASKYGLVNINGTEVLPCSYGKITVFSDDRAWIRVGRPRTSASDDGADDKWMCINPQGQVLFSFPGNYTVHAFTHGLAAVINKEQMNIDKNALVGFCDVNGNMAIPMIYNLKMTSERGWTVPIFEDWTEPRATVSYQGNNGYLTTDGKFHKE